MAVEESKDGAYAEPAGEVASRGHGNFQATAREIIRDRRTGVEDLGDVLVLQYNQGVPSPKGKTHLLP